MLSLTEIPEPNWNDMPDTVSVVKEETFDLDDYIISEIHRVWENVEKTVSIY